MAAPSGNFWGVGARYARVLVLDNNGYPAASGTTVYEGYELASLKGFTNEWADVRPINHYGGDRVRATDTLPPNQAGTANATVGSIDPAVYAALSSTKAATIGEATVIGFGTSKQGYEADVALFAVQQQVNSSGLRRWKMDLAPVARATFKNASLNENPAEYTVNLNLSVTDKYPWGINFAEATEGYTTAQGLAVFTNNFPWIVAFKGDNIETEFDFASGHEAYSTDEIHGVWIYDASAGTVAEDTTATLATNKVTPTAKPDSGDLVIVFYNLATAPE
jgi:hypothetical protein